MKAAGQDAERRTPGTQTMGIRGNQVRLGIEVPRDETIVRDKIADREPPPTKAAG